MYSYIIENLEFINPDINSLSIKSKNKLADDVIESYKAFMNCRTFDDLRQYTADAFLYKYILNEGFLINTKLDSKYRHGWTVYKKYHKYISIINSKSKICTYDSYNATKYNKAGINGFIEGKYLIQLEDYIKNKHPNVFSMSRIKLIHDDKDYKKLLDLCEKYDFKGPYYQNETEYINDELILLPGYRTFYNNITNMILQVNRFVEKIIYLVEDKTLNSYLKINSKQAKKDLLDDFKSRDLYVISFLGNNINDNTMFKVLSEFTPTD